MMKWAPWGFRHIVGGSLIAMVVVVAVLQDVVHSGEPKLNWSELWLAKSAGTWERNNAYGYFKVLVFRQLGEHAHDRVQIQITRVDPEKYTEKVVNSYWLESPGVKGNVADLHFRKIDDHRMALMMDIYMKGMEGIVLREAFLLLPDGKHKRLTEAEHVDIYGK